MKKTRVGQRLTPKLTLKEVSAKPVDGQTLDELVEILKRLNNPIKYIDHINRKVIMMVGE